ncbi:MAG: hypothetical protein AAGB00_09625 [Planctomycetota bacterium]
MAENPYQSPSTEDQSAHSPSLPRGVSRRSVFWLLAIGVIAGVAIGAATNAVNGLVCPQYFSIVMGWKLPGWRRIVEQGIIEGAATGLIFAIVLLAVVGLRTGGRARLTDALPYFWATCSAVLALWALGGMMGCGWATLDGASYRAAFPIAPAAGTPAFGWVGGSIWGAQLGGAAATVVVSTVFWLRWRAHAS